MTWDSQTLGMLPGLFGAFGKSATYSAAGVGAPEACTVIFDEAPELEPGTAFAQVAALPKTVDVRISEVASPARGDTFVIGGTTYTVDAVIENDGQIARCAVK